MGHGRHIGAELRQRIVHQVLTLKSPMTDSYNAVFVGITTEYTYQSFKKLVQKLRKLTNDQVDEYVLGPISRKVAGRKRKFDNETRIALVELRVQHHTVKLDRLRALFTKYYANPDMPSAPSRSTLSRMMTKAGLSRKVTTMRNIRANPAAQLQYLNNIAPINPYNIIDFDETLCTAAEFHNKYGWSPVGEPAYYNQINIGGVAYSTIAAYTVLGFICWSVYVGSVTGVEVQDFLHNDLRPFIHDQSHIVLDNAATHKTAEVVEMLGNVSNNNYTFCAPYSPHLKPVEFGFSNIKRWIRENEQQALADPVEYINRAFHMYSIHGERSTAGKFFCFIQLFLITIHGIYFPFALHAAAGHWGGYFSNHQQYLDHGGDEGYNNNNGDNNNDDEDGEVDNNAYDDDDDDDGEGNALNV